MTKIYLLRISALIALLFLAAGTACADIRDGPLHPEDAVIMAIPAAMTGFPESIPAAYTSIRADLEALAASLRSAGLPDSLLRIRMEEAARKRVQPPTLLAALRTEIARLISLAGTLRGLGLFPQNRDDVAAFFGQAATLMRSGIGEREVKAALEAARAKGDAKSAESLARALAALSVVAEAEAAYRLGEGGRLRLAGALIDSSLPVSEFGTVLDSLSDLRAGGESVAVALERALGELGQGPAMRAPAVPPLGSGGTPGSPRPDPPGGPGAGTGQPPSPGGGPGGGGPGGGAPRGR